MKSTTKSPRKPKFRSNKAGLYVRTGSKGYRKISPALKLNAIARTKDGRTFGLIRFRDLDGKARQLLVPRSDLRKTKLILERLDDLGFETPTQKKDRVLVGAYLSTASPKSRAKLIERIGWHKARFVLPDRVIGDGKAKLTYHPPDWDQAGDFSQKGGLLDWQDQVAKLCSSSSRLVFAICVALASPLLKWSRTESGGFHLVGKSSAGKTTALVVARSVCGRALRGELTGWDTTAAGLEETAVGHSDTVLVLDELSRLARTKQAAAARTREVAYLLASGQGKVRASAFGYGKTKDRNSWRLLMLSSGETGLLDLAAHGGGQRDRGEQVRLIDIPAEPDRGHGIFERLPKDQQNPAELAETIEANCANYHGSPLRAFLEKLVGQTNHLPSLTQEYIDQFFDRALVPTDHGWERRFAKRFGLAYAAGRLAIEAEVLPWSEELIADSIHHVYRDARAALPDCDRLIDSALKRIGLYVKSPKFVVRLKAGKPVPGTQIDLAKAKAFHKKLPNGKSYFLIRPKLLEAWVGDLIPARLVVEALQERGYLAGDKARGLPTRQVKIKGLRKRRRYYCVSERIEGSGDGKTRRADQARP